MQIRALRWNLMMWDPSAGPADPYGAPRLARFARMVRARRRPICLVCGALLMVMGLTLPSAVVFIAGVLAVGSSVPDGRLPSATAARVGTWAWLDKKRAPVPEQRG